jgi:hypothetical protein
LFHIEWPEWPMIASLFFLAFVALVLAGTIFWILMIIECATKEPSYGNDKLIWILIIIFTHWIGALIYYFVRRPQRIAQFRRRAQLNRRYD